MRQRTGTSRRPISQRGFLQRHFIFGLALILLTASSILFITYANWKQQTDAVALKTKQAKQFAQLDADVKATLARKVAAARKAEADAKAAAAAQAAVPKPIISQASTTQAKCDVTTPASITIVINKKHCFNPSNWAPANLVAVDGFYLQSQAASAMTAMMNDAAAAGVGFGITSSYRSYDSQLATYNNWVAVNGSTTSADTVSARPGYSEHQTGLAADLKAGSCVLDCFGGTPQYRWLQAHASDYGFIERYIAGLTSITGYSPEPWHWRYVGPTTAKDMKAKGIQTLETYFGISGGDYAQ